MMDFLKSYPFLTVEDYYWNYSYIMIQLMLRDASKVIYLTEKQAKQMKTKKTAVRIDDPMQLMADTGMPIFKPKEE